MHETTTDNRQIVVRRLLPADCEAVVRLDAQLVGRRRSEYFRLKLDESLARSGVAISLAVEVDGGFVGFLLTRVYYGEFGLLEPAAVLDTFGVHPDFRGIGVGAALLAELRRHLAALGVRTLQTEVSWDDQPLLAFFQHAGFRPAARICLDLALTAE